MNWNRIEGNWTEFKGKAQAKWGKLTGDDLDVINGNRKKLSGRLQALYGKTQEDVEQEIDEWTKIH
ncbi:CsbD family protein [Allorhizobium sp. BGMRC 0089]|uniref:CsbD family protein n=1 Tax=Allorhizobium sonneratiae TaxID=2934936 RepID=UPI002033FA1B|nr:CsbD family protein [Allorhizobium sonneratiae]MCM2294770.1 CsbD family protein [Allorhizobium sonneratiae]